MSVKTVQDERYAALATLAGNNYLTLPDLEYLYGNTPPTPPTDPPVNTSLPAIVGTPEVGQTLLATTGTWTNSPTGFTYQWQRGTTNISGATASSYVVVSADIGQTIRVRVNASNVIGNTAATSVSTAVVPDPNPPSGVLRTYTSTDDFIYGGMTNGPSNQILAAVGDSLTDRLYELETNTISVGIAGGKFTQALNIGVQGNTVQDILARIDNSYNAATATDRGMAGFPAAMGVSKIGMIYLKCGTNNGRAGNGWSTISTAYDQLVTKCLTYAEYVTICTIPPIVSPESSFATKDAAVQDINAGIVAYAAAHPDKVILADGAKFLRAGNSPTGAGLDVFYNGTDGIHPINSGVRAQGVAEGNDLAAAIVARGWSIPSTLVTSNADVYPATNQWAQNPAGVGTTASAGNWPGTVVTGVTVGASGSGAGTVSVLAADVGDLNQVPWTIITPTQGQTTGWTQVNIANAGRSITASDPSRMEALVEVRFDNLDLTNVKRLTFSARGNTSNNQYLIPRFWIGLGPQPINFTNKMIMRCSLPRTGGVVESGMTLFVALEYQTTFSGATMGSFGIRCLSLRG